MHSKEAIASGGFLRSVLGPLNENKKASATGFFLGLTAAIADIGYFRYAGSHGILTPDALWLLLLSLNPPSLLEVMFIDVEPTTTQLVTLCVVVVLLNAILYAVIAKLTARVWGAYARRDTSQLR